VSARAERLCFLAAVALVAGLAGCATSGSSRGIQPDHGLVQRDSGLGEEGHASYYSDVFAGRRTASGERYDPERMTAAHPTLPLGTWIRVTRVDDGRFVDVRVNDRCGCGGGRSVDLSRKAARYLDMMRAGVVPVRIEVLRK
jgi:rare lipoprotein A